MAIHQQRVPPHWNYFLALEEDLQRLSRWIEFERANHGCYSIELARLLMTATQEADVVAKRICADCDPKVGAENVGAYRRVLLAKYPGLSKAKASIPRHGLTLAPWSNWAKGTDPPAWWTANNKVKHERTTHFDRANLNNVLNASAGLFILLVVYYGRSLASIEPAPRLFAPVSYARVEGSLMVFAPKWS